MRPTLLLGALALLVTPVFCQTVQISKVELAGENIIVHYDLDDSSPGHEYLLNLYSSRDNFNAPLAMVTGDIGAEIKPGSGRKAVWAVRKEYGGYKGKLSLEIRGRVYVPFVKLTNFTVSKSYKRGKSYPLFWKPGATNPIHVELYKGDTRVAGEQNQPNSGNYTLNIPAKAKKGKNYKLKITDSRNGDEVVYSKPFGVKSKIPLLLKVLPIAAAGGAAAFLGGTPKDNGIADPPLPSSTKN